MMRIIFLVVLLLFALAPAAPAEAPTFPVDAVMIGDMARYEGALNVTVAITDVQDTHDVRGDLVPTYEARIESDEHRGGFLERISPSSGQLVAVGYDCWYWSSSIGCASTGWTWGSGGVGIFGASMLAGRTLTSGSADEGCSDCDARIMISPPADDSPSGTLFVASVEMPEGAAWPFDRVRILHMDTSVFPLRIEVPARGDGWAIERVDVARGVDAVPERPEPVPSEMRWMPAPWEGGRPAEGTPLPGHVAWGFARDARGIGPHAVGDCTGAITYEPGQHSYSRILGVVVNTSRTISFEEQVVQTGGAVDHRLRGTWLFPDVTPKETIQWTTDAKPTESPFAACACRPETIPLWDLVDRALATEIIDGFSGYTGRFTCNNPTFDVYAAPEGSLFQPTSYLALDPRNGDLQFALIAR